MTSLRWLHLSDFHTGKDGYGQRRLFQYILEHVKSRVDSGLAPDFVFITGDITNKGKPDQYEEFNEKFLLPLIGFLPHDSQKRIYLIPGNHDVDRNQTRAAQTYDIQVKIPEFFDPDEKGRFERQQTVFPRFQAFVENDMINIENHWLFSSEGVFSSMVPFENLKVGILGINTAWLSHSDHDRNKLSAGKGLLETGLEKIKEGDLKFVLGHHPIEWLLDTELEPVRALLGRHNTIYLHGHMHKGRAKYEEGAGYPFIAIQSGACFQAREDDLWVNRFMWCEINTETGEISNEPLQWSNSNQEWVLDSLAFPDKYRQGDRWIVSLPQPAPVELKSVPVKSSAQKFRDLPKGWVIVDAKYIKSLANELTAEQALSFFDGRPPIWREAIAPQIPRREIVNKLTETLNSAQKTGRTQVTLLVGASGEGKTTALLQTICDLVKGSNDWHILWHDDPSSPFPAEFIARLPKNGTWLIASDDAELIARRVYDTTQLLTDKHNLQFLLCCRDTDWRGVGADRFNWKSHNIQFNQLSLRGLSSNDAEQVVLAWSRYGKEGLRELRDLKLDDATLQLVDAAKSEQTNNSEGTFFGAILEIRFGSELKNHVSNLIGKLTGRSITASSTLGDAFAYISAMHTEDFQFLSKEVLAEVLGVKLNNLKRSVLGPLGEEAAIATTGSFIFTRHRSIARAALQILSDEYSLDIENIYFDLVKAAMLKGQSEFIPSYSSWVYLCSDFFNKGNQGLGIRLAKLVLEITPEDMFSIVKLSQLYREANQPEQSVKLLRSTKPETFRQRSDRPFYYEWGVSEGSVGNLALSICLSAYSLSDEIARRPPNYEEAKFILAGISYTFAELYDKFGKNVFIEACGAAAQLGLVINKNTASQNWQYLNKSLQRSKLAQVKDVPNQVAVERIKAGIASALEQIEDELPELITHPNMLSFHGLTGLLRT